MLRADINPGLKELRESYSAEIKYSKAGHSYISLIRASWIKRPFAG
jgi:hypothetical protein